MAKRQKGKGEWSESKKWGTSLVFDEHPRFSDSATSSPHSAAPEHGNVSLIKRYCAVSDKNISEQLRKYLGRNHQLPGPGYGDENSSWGTQWAISHSYHGLSRWEDKMVMVIMLWGSHMIPHDQEAEGILLVSSCWISVLRRGMFVKARGLAVAHTQPIMRARPWATTGHHRRMVTWSPSPHYKRI